MPYKNKEDKARNHKEYKKNNLPAIRAIERRCYDKLRLEAVIAYGGKCSCGFDDARALQIDHVNDDGAEQRKSGLKGIRFYRWLKKNKFPVGFQILCANCNWIKEIDRRASCQMKKY